MAKTASRVRKRKISAGLGRRRPDRNRASPIRVASFTVANTFRKSRNDCAAELDHRALTVRTEKHEQAPDAAGRIAHERSKAVGLPDRTGRFDVHLHGLSRGYWLVGPHEQAGRRDQILRIARFRPFDGAIKKAQVGGREFADPDGFRALVGDAEPKLDRAPRHQVSHLLRCDRDAGGRIVQSGNLSLVGLERDGYGVFHIGDREARDRHYQSGGENDGGRDAIFSRYQMVSFAGLDGLVARHQERFPQPITEPREGEHYPDQVPSHDRRKTIAGEVELEAGERSDRVFKRTCVTRDGNPIARSDYRARILDIQHRMNVIAARNPAAQSELVLVVFAKLERHRRHAVDAIDEARGPDEYRPRDADIKERQPIRLRDFERPTRHHVKPAGDRKILVYINVISR